MPRTREFDATDALYKATLVFWEKGYANTSVEDLVAATGVNRSGLYEEFGSKRGLFIACLRYYQDSIVSMAFGIVEQAGASVANVRRYFARVLELSATELGKLGCFMANTANDVAFLDSEAAAEVERFRNRQRAGFNTALSRAKSEGKLPQYVNTEQTSDFFTAVAQGLSTMARSKADSRIMANTVSIALSCLD